jgi:restriction system protein
VKGLQFEQNIFFRLRDLGWNVELTPSSNDYGADLICTLGNEKLVVQCKTYSSRSIGISAIQEVLGAIAHYRGSFGALIFRGKVTKNALKLADSSKIYVISIDDLEVGCPLDRLKESLKIGEAKERQLKRENSRRRAQAKKNEEIGKYIDEFIKNYIQINSEQWKENWLKIYEDDVCQFEKWKIFKNQRENKILLSTTVSAFSLTLSFILHRTNRNLFYNFDSMIGLIAISAAIFAIFSYFHDKPQPRQKTSSRYEVYKKTMMQKNRKDIYKKARVWAQQKYENRNDDHKAENSIFK